MIVLPEAEEELFAAVGWYEEQREGLGTELFDAIERTLGRILLDGASSFPSVAEDPRARRVLVPRFPYAVVFFADVDTVRVIAFAHLKRAPGYWSERVP